jgi:hypothetical protein
LFRSNERGEGQVVVLFALFAIVLVGILALAIDVGYLYSERRELQSAADAAALAGGAALINGATNAQIDASADAYLAANGVDGSGSPVINVAIAGNRRAGTVTVDVERDVQRFFLGAIYAGAWEVGAHAVAEIVNQRDARYALIALEPPGIYVNGDMEITIENGSIMSNDIIDSSGTSNIVVVDGTIDAAGTISGNPSWIAPDGMHSKRPTLDDPLASMAPPDPATLPVIEEDDLPDCQAADCVLQPGYYLGLGKIRVNYTMKLQPGMYYFEGTSIDMITTNARIANSTDAGGVMLYFTGPAGTTYFDPKNAGVHLVAPATPYYDGGHPGMLIWIDNCSNFDSQGNNEFYLEGVFYAPCSDVTMHGNPYGDAVNGQVIAGSVDIRGTTDFTISYNDYVTTRRFEVYLVE